MLLIITRKIKMLLWLNIAACFVAILVKQSNGETVIPPRAATCPINTFRCRTSSACILKKYKCDGQKDCEDGSDEDDCMSTMKDKKGKKSTAGGRSTSGSKTVPDDFKCPNNLFTCDNKECVMRASRCDGTMHCSDGSDEKGCRKDKSGKTLPEVDENFKCPGQLFTCANKECVIPDARCNKEKDCSDGSDEWDCAGSANPKKKNKPKTSKAKKPKVTKKPPTSSRSRTPTPPPPPPHPGGRNPKNRPEDYPNFTCPHSLFTCSNKECVRGDARCDGTKDCTDGSDEKGCGRRKPKKKDPFPKGKQTHRQRLNLPCGGGLFSCIDKSKCLLPLQRCDGEKQCDDGSDEWECPEDVEGMAPPYSRAPKVPRKPKPGEWVGPKPKTSTWKCPGEYFTCKNKQCILPSYKCDGKKDCTDGSDEVHCIEKEFFPKEDEEEDEEEDMGESGFKPPPRKDLDDKIPDLKKAASIKKAMEAERERRRQAQGGQYQEESSKAKSTDEVFGKKEEDTCSKDDAECNKKDKIETGREKCSDKDAKDGICSKKESSKTADETADKSADKSCSKDSKDNGGMCSAEDSTKQKNTGKTEAAGAAKTTKRGTDYNPQGEPNVAEDDPTLKKATGKDGREKQSGSKTDEAKKKQERSNKEKNQKENIDAKSDSKTADEKSEKSPQNEKDKKTSSKKSNKKDKSKDEL